MGRHCSVLLFLIVLIAIASTAGHDSSSIENEVFGEFTSQNPLTEEVETSLRHDDQPARALLEDAALQAQALSKLSQDGSLGSATLSKFSWLTELFDHHNFKAKDYGDVSKNCSYQMAEYLRDLKQGKEWAGKVFDASGRYNSQFFFGNDFWLGSAIFCSELTREMIEGRKLSIKTGLPPFPVSYSVAKVEIYLGNITMQNRIVSIGMCLPTSCNDNDVLKIAQAATNSAKTDLKKIQVELPDPSLGLKLVKVRRVPGDYDIFTDKKFQIVGGVFLSIFTIMIVASIYEVRLNKCNKRRQQQEHQHCDSEIQNNNNDSISGGSDQDSAGDAMDRKLSKKKPQCAAREKLGTDLFSQILLSFSVVSNTDKIMRTKESGEDSIGCIHGLRFLSLAWVVMVHTYLQIFSVAENKTMRNIVEKNAFYQTVANASFSVDTFFFISGLLVTFLYSKTYDMKMKKREERKKDEITVSNMTIYSNGNTAKIQTFTCSNMAVAESEQQLPSSEFPKKMRKERGDSNVKDFIMLILYRFVRLTPAYFFVMMLSEMTLKYANKYSVFEPVMRDAVTCADYWWRNVLYINNFYPHVDMCMLWSWYMANDFQFYVIGLILMLVAKKHFKASTVTLFILLAASWVTSGYISLTLNYRARIEDPFEMFDPLYDKPWSRLGPYLIGMITGWGLWRYRGRIVIPTWLMLVGWPCALAIMASLIYGMNDGKLELWPTAFYVSIGHTAWGVAIGWVVLNCVVRPKSLLARALSYRGLLPLSRLAYCAYLVHPVVMMHTSLLMDGPIHLHNIMVLVIYAGYTAISYLLALIISLVFEAPIVRLLKISTSRPKQ